MVTENYTDRLSEAAACLAEGGLVAVPTETVYGLAANGMNPQAVAQIYLVKGRPEHKPISLLVSGPEAMDVLCEDVPDAARALANAFWPGPLTIVLKAKPGIPNILRAGGETIALRCPAHETTLALLSKLPFPLAAPSANPSGSESPTTMAKVLEYFDGKIEGCIDGGDCRFGNESTIFDMTKCPYKILRQGALSAYDIDMALVSELNLIGITGGTGCGKTSALEIAKQMGAIAIDADEVYHELLKSNMQLKNALKERFSELVGDGEIDTKRIGDYVFANPEALRDLNQITHRFVSEEITSRLSNWAKMGGKFAVIDAIALVENGVGSFCKATVAITAPTEARLARLMCREGVSEEYARLRIAAQKPNEYFEEVCDYTIANDSTLEAFYTECERVFKQILEK